MFPFLAIENVVHVLKENCASEEVKLSMLCLFVCYYILRFCKTCIYFFFFHNVKLKVNKLLEILSP